MPRTIRATQRGGFSLAEAVISVVIVGIMMVAALNLVGTSARARLINARLGVGPGLAHDLMSEVLQARYRDPDTVPVVIDGSEVELASHDPASGNSGTFRVKDNTWVAQYFVPVLPADAQSWSVTRVVFKAKTDGQQNGTASVQLRTPDGSNAPSATVLEEHPMVENTLSSGFTWEQFDFSSVSERTPGSGLFLAIVRQVNDAEICHIELEDATNPGPGFYETYDAGGYWNTRGNTSFYYYVYGRVTTSIAPGTTIGVDSPESTTTRADFDDVDDYHGWSASPPETKDGTPLSDYPGWTREVSVEYVTPSSPDGSKVSEDRGVKRIKVVVTDPRGHVTTLIALRSEAGVYEQEVAATKTYATWVGLDLQVGDANPALSLGTALANEPVVCTLGQKNDPCNTDADCCSGICNLKKCKD